MSIRSAAKLPLKRLIGAWKGVRLEGDAFVSVGATVRGTGRFVLGAGARLKSGAELSATRQGSIAVGEGTNISKGVVVSVGDGHVSIGRDCSVRYYAVIYGHGGVTLGDRVLIGNHCLISSSDHTYEGVAPVALQPMRYAPVVIEDDVWIGAHCVVLAGVRIGQGAIVGSHSLVKEDVAPFAIVGGVPSRLLRMRAEQQ